MAVANAKAAEVAVDADTNKWSPLLPLMANNIHKKR